MAKLLQSITVNLHVVNRPLLCAGAICLKLGNWLTGKSVSVEANGKKVGRPLRLQPTVKMKTNDTLVRPLNTVTTVPGAANPFVKVKDKFRNAPEPPPDREMRKGGA